MDRRIEQLGHTLYAPALRLAAAAVEHRLEVAELPLERDGLGLLEVIGA